MLAATSGSTTADIGVLGLSILGSSVADKVYDGTTDATVAVGSLSGAVAGDLLTVGASGSFADANAGADKPVAVSYSLGGADAANYSLAGETLYADILPRSITVAADSASKTVGQPDPLLRYRLTAGSLIGTDALTGGLTRTAGESVGTYRIGSGTLAASTNYTLTFVDGKFTINAVATDAAEAVTRALDQTGNPQTPGTDSGGDDLLAALSGGDSEQQGGDEEEQEGGQPTSLAGIDDEAELPTGDAPDADPGGAPMPANPAAAVREQPEVVAAAETVRETISGGGSLHETVVAISGGGRLGDTQVRAVFESVSAGEIVNSLTRSDNPAAAAVGALLDNTLRTGSVRQAEVRQALNQGGFAPEVQRTYLNLFQRVQHEQRTQLFQGALAELKANPEAASVFGRPGGAPAGAPAAEPAPSAPSDGGAPADETGPGTTSDTAPPPAGIDLPLGGIALSGFSPRGLAIVEAQVEPPTPDSQARINGRWAFVDDDGTIRTELPLKAGDNDLKVEVIENKQVTDSYAIEVQSPRAAAATDLPQGRRVALMFAVEDYDEQMIPRLETPAADAELIAGQLNQMLGYETRIVRNPTRAQLVEELRKLGEELTESDSVVVYYAGHGYAMEDTGMGYWLPADAQVSSAANWISNQDVGRLLNRVPAKQVMLVSDSCYSGAFTREATAVKDKLLKDPIRAAGRRAVMAMSSGGNEPVMDGDVNSPFAAALARGLATAGQKAGGAIDLFEQVRADVTASVPQTPQYGVVLSAGYDPGADFVMAPPRGGAASF